MDLLKSEEAFTEAINTTGVVLIDCFATWCGPCKMLAPILESVQAEGVEKYKVDIEEFPSITSEYGITSVPTVLIFKNGEVVKTMAGVQPKVVYETKLAELK